MKILMIIPKYTYNNNLSRDKNYHYETPLGIGYIISMLKQAGHEVDCLNLNHFEGKVKHLIKRSLDLKKYDFVCTGHNGIGYQMVDKILETIKAHVSKPKTIVGGPIITSEPVLMANSLKPDFGVIGEGEKTVVELLDCIEKKGDLKKVDGIFYNDFGRYVFTSPRAPIMDLDSLPYPDFDAMGFREKLEHLSCSEQLYGTMDYPRTYPIIGSRGCPFKCTFCYRILGDAYRIRSVKSVVDEIKYAIKKYDINSFQLLDDLFASNKKRILEFCAEIKKIKENFPGEFKWVCSLWVSVVDEELLKIMKDVGCSCIGFGFESYSKEVLKSMKKYITLEQIDSAIKTCWRVNMPFVGNFIFGDIAETKETAKETLDYWKKECKDQIKLFFIHPYPNSEIYQHAVKKGVIKDKLDFIKNKIHHTNIMNLTDNLTDKEFDDLKKQVFYLIATKSNYIVPFKVKKTGKKDIYDLYVMCPFCKKVSIHRNQNLPNLNYYHDHPHCRNCGMRYHISSRLYKFTMKYYLKLDFLRRNYLLIRDKLLARRL